METPERIFLQIEEDDYDGMEELSLADATWCADRIYKSDIEYIRYSDVEAILAEVARRWGDDYPGSTVGILGRLAKKILEQRGNPADLDEI